MYHASIADLRSTAFIVRQCDNALGRKLFDTSRIPNTCFTCYPACLKFGITIVVNNFVIQFILGINQQQKILVLFEK